MRKYNSLIFIAVTAFIMAVGCKKYEQFPVTQVTIDKVFDPLDSAGENSEKFLNTLYSKIPGGHNRVGGDYLDAATNDAVSSNIDPTNQVTRLATGNFDAANFPDSERDIWRDSYQIIRTANIFITNIEVVPYNTRYKGYSIKYLRRNEARFIRALAYFDLVKRYGGVPLLGNRVFTINDDVKLPRNTFDDCIKYIVGECDAIKDTLLTLPLTVPFAPSTESFRPTKGSAMALKARVLLYAASPLFNGGNIDGANPYTGYASYDANRWAQAATAAKDVMDLGYYTLLTDYRSVYNIVANNEIIFYRSAGTYGHGVESTNAPIGYPRAPGDGRTSPTQNLVDAFPMSNGLPITDAGSGYKATDPYSNRDPRFYANILYNGARWLKTNLQTYEGGASKPNTSIQQTRTSYYMRKFMGAAEETDGYVDHSINWTILRFADIMMYYAEATNESSGPTAAVYSVLTQIRQRAGIQPGTNGLYGLKAGMTQAEMRTAIQNERRIEFAFEESRFWDIRRWKIAETIMNQPSIGASITFAGAYSYPVILANRFFSPKAYLYPIPFAEIQSNPNIRQNPGW